MTRRAVLLLAACGALGGAPASAPDPSRLTLEQAVNWALVKNLDLEIERIEPMIAREQVLAARGEFAPVAGFSGGYARQRRFSNSVLELSLDEGLIRETIVTQQISLGGKAASGTEYEVSVSAPAFETDNPLRLFDVSFTPVASLKASQPLVRGFGTGFNRVRIRQAEEAETQARHEVAARMLELVRDVESFYWALSYAQEHVGVTQGNLDLAEDLLERLGRMKDAGLASTLDVLDARLAASVRRAQVTRARSEVVNAQARLRGLVDPDLGPGAALVAVERPLEEGPPQDLAARVDEALARRPELRHQASVVESLLLEERRALSNSRWRIDAVGGASYSSLGGHDPGPRVLGDLPEDLKGREDYWDAFTEGNFSWSVGVQVEVPLGGRAALAQLEPARLRRRQEEIRLSSLRSRIEIEVETAFQDMTTEWSELQNAREAVGLARQHLEAEERGLTAGITTVRRLLEGQDRLAVTRDAEMKALVNYAAARARLRAVQGASFDAHQLVVEP